MPTFYETGSYSVITYDTKMYPNTSIYKKLYPNALEKEGKLVVYKVRFMCESHSYQSSYINNLFKEIYGVAVKNICQIV